MAEVRAGDSADRPRGRPGKIGRYELVGRLGKGAMGIVYSARDENMNRQVAVKVLMADLEGDPDVRARFLREAKLAGRLIHRNVVTIFDVGEEDGRLFIVMELLQGKTLADLTGPGESLEFETKLDVMIQLCEGLGAAHARGVVHRDIKPSNLFIQRDGSLKIVDFGIARVASSNLTATGLLIGTPDFMSPEQARGGEIDHRSDLFSAGCVLYFLLTSHRPFAAADLPGILNNVERADPPPIADSDAPPALQRVVKRALTKHPDGRYQQATEMHADLVRFRQQFEHESHQLAVASAKVWQELSGLVDAYRRDLAAMPLDTDAPVDVPSAAGLSSRFPVLIERGVDAITGGLVGRRGLIEIADRLGTARETLSQLMSRLNEARSRLSAADRALGAGDPAAALPHLAAVLEAYPASEAIRAKVRECQALVGPRRQLAADLAAAVAIRQRAIDAVTRARETFVTDPDSAVESLTRFVAGQPGSPVARVELHALATEAQRAATLARQQDEANRHIARSETLFEQGDVAGSLKAAEAALALSRHEARALRIQGMARAVLRESERRRAVKADAAACARRAKALADAGDFSRALTEMQSAFDLDPASVPIAAQLARLRQHGDMSREPEPGTRLNALRAEGARPLVDAAETARRAGDWVNAKSAAEDVLALLADHPEALEIRAAADQALALELDAAEATIVVIPSSPLPATDSPTTVLFDFQAILDQRLRARGGGVKE